MDSPSRVFVFDVDGTLVPHSQNKFDKSAVKTLRLASFYGDIILASARPYKGIMGLFTEKTAKVRYIVALNGAIAYDTRSNNPLYSSEISLDIVSFFFERKQIVDDLWFYSQDTWFANNPRSNSCLIEKKAVRCEPLQLDQNALKSPVLKITIITRNITGLEKGILKDMPEKDLLSVSRSNPFYCEMTSKNASKEFGVNYILNKFLRKKESNNQIVLISIGDSDNDLELLKCSSISCAVGNATQRLKNIADFVSESEYGDGAYECIKHAITKNC
jgi:Cof subfamily protein (haloacid dehalogenase superfamily)